MSERKYRVATFNLKDLHVSGEKFHGTRQYSLREYASKVAWTAGLMKSMRADLIACQEVFSETALGDTAERAGYDRSNIYMSKATGEGNSSVGIVSKLPIKKVEEVDRFPAGMATTSLKMGHQNKEVQLKYFTRPVLKAVVEMNGQNVTVFASHLRSGNPAKVHDPSLSKEEREKEGALRSAIIQMAEAKALRKLITDEVKKHPKQPLIVLGDFNQDVNSPIQKIIRGSDLTERGEKTPFIAHEMKSVVNSYREKSADKDAGTFVYKGEMIALDDIMLSPHFQEPTVSSARAHLEAVEIRNEHLYEPDVKEQGSFNEKSDHAPVVAEISVPERKKGPQGKKAQKLAKKQRLARNSAR